MNKQPSYFEMKAFIAAIETISRVGGIFTDVAFLLSTQVVEIVTAQITQSLLEYIDAFRNYYEFDSSVPTVIPMIIAFYEAHPNEPLCEAKLASWKKALENWQKEQEESSEDFGNEGVWEDFVGRLFDD